jgi:MFS family permease
MGIFVVGAVASGLANSIALLIAFQAIQGIGSALMVPQSLAIINATFREAERGRAIGLWAGISGGIAALGPWLGGWLVENIAWAGVFWMSVPVVLTAMAVTWREVPDHSGTQKGPLDWPGALLILFGLTGIAYAMISGPNQGWNHPLVLIALTAGVAAAAGFIAVEKKSPAPLVRLSIFRNRLISGANLATLLLYFAFNGTIVFTVLNLQQVQGLSPSQAGLGLLPPTILITLLAASAGSLADRIGPRKQMIGGPLLVSAGILWLTMGGINADYFIHFLPGLILAGAGMALLIAPLTKSAMAVAPSLSGVASGVNNAIARTAGLMAVAILGSVMLAFFSPALESNVEQSGLSSAQRIEIIAQSDKLGGVVIPEEFGNPAAQSAREAIATAFVTAYRGTMAICATLAVTASGVAFLTIDRKRTRMLTEGIMDSSRTVMDKGNDEGTNSSPGKLP